MTKTEQTETASAILKNISENIINQISNKDLPDTWGSDQITQYIYDLYKYKVNSRVLRGKQRAAYQLDCSVFNLYGGNWDEST